MAKNIRRCGGWTPKQAQTRLTNDTAEEYAAIQVAKQRHKSMSLPTRKRKQEQEW